MDKHMKIYAEHLEDSALEQFNSAMGQEFAIKGALMPDAHTGYSLPIGAVVASDGVVVPAWVGYDIGCGMCALPTSFESNDVTASSEEIFKEIYKKVPVGFNVNQHPVDCHLNPDDLSQLGRKAFEDRKGFRALGSLGGGNHFIEIGKDEEGKIWVIIHSGSRGVGHGIATEYMRLASGTQKILEGHHGLRVDDDTGRGYINDMSWALEFALANRKEMMRRIVGAISAYCDGEADWDKLINRNHNHAEEKDGMWIHRKGATHAEEGMMGVIPGNMRDGSFIVEGKGNPDALWSSSHGAGRVLGRKQAKRELKTEDFQETMRGITARVEDSTLDESPMAYKDIFEVMRLQADLVDVCQHVTPIVNVKG
ncbi:RtcB family protein [endosymbiont of Ridgeia piscesae]|jgi:tRNA-splicing ligase RtcB|uniref:3'-phosphate/5'-hydroxy nucleic acid ligase n=1 Tax=endosymbiont of Ridgeia piscesae TaxID=54398 RepID=A0A0T5Z7G6_9GAMM|nr:RtcB family protein [endosymbiont of Ridgeia piscesae]KRT56449.1 RNA-splicing ligase RtcB, repairs tRNA damage [endosymbiont of Ridgeia piscesae]KRT58784.1 tRNA-splicing ligase RtcB [endosymbiont of Ridgeia piscesae]